MLSRFADFFMNRPVTKFILAKKSHQTQLFDEAGNVVPVTVVAASPNQVTQIKTVASDGYSAVQVGLGQRRAKTVSRAEQGQTKKLGKVFAARREFHVVEPKLKVGDQIDIKQFAVGDRVKVTGTSRGLGFQGVVKRHGFHGQPASHGHKDQLRHSGSIGAGGVQRTFKGVRMGGHMGNARVTTAGLEVVKIDSEKNELYLRGAVPGSRNALVAIYQ